MFTGLVMCLIIVTGVMVYRVKEAVDTNDRRAVYLRSVAMLPVAIIAGAACWAMLHYPTLASKRPPGLLGDGLDCANYGMGGADVCFKERKK